VPGIISSRIGHLGGNEIVEVEYDLAKTNLNEMTKALKNQSSFYSLIAKNKDEAAEAKTFLKDSEIKINFSEPHFIESKYSLKTQHPDLYYLDLTEPQAIALNSWSYFSGKMPEVLTPEQKKLREKLKIKLRSSNPSDLRPARSGKELQAYRENLLQWLEK